MTEYVETFLCPVCGGAASGRGHLCHPNKDSKPYACKFCSQTVEDPRHVCTKMIDSLEYQCLKCGRLAVYDSSLCEPEPIDKE